MHQCLSCPAHSCGEVRCAYGVQELQKKYLEAKSLAKQAESTRKTREKEKNKAELTQQEIEPMSESTGMYKAVGKAFVLSDKSTLMSQLSESIDEAKKDSSKYSSQAEYMQKQADEHEQAIRELLHSNEALQQEVVRAQQAQQQQAQR